MTEELVTLETAKMLREKGFNERTLFAYKNNGDLYQDFNRIESSYNSLPVPELCENFHTCESDNPCYKCGTAVYLTSAPNQSFAQKWLRETKNLHIEVYRNTCGYGYVIVKADSGIWMEDDNSKGPNDGGKWGTYEEALEAGIQEALKLI